MKTSLRVSLLFALCACRDEAPRVAEPPAVHRPAPTENLLDHDAEERNKHARKEWIRQMHRAPPGIDTSARERENGLRQLSRRAALRRAPPDATPGRWVERGSVNQAGRMHAARLNANKDTLYAGSSLGGVWRGEPDGSGWEPIGDNLYGGAQWLEVLGPTDILFAATDNGLAHRSLDGGQSWEEPVGLGNFASIRRLLKLEDGSEALFLLGSGDRRSRLYRSLDLGASFEQIADLDGYPGDLWASRTGDSALYLASGGQVLRSDDLGDTWTPLGVFDSSSQRAELCGSEAGAPRLWVISGNQRLLRSDDAGETWQSLGDISDYWGELNASIEDPDLFVFGGMELHISADGGANFAIHNAWGDYYGDPANLLHADTMGVQVELDADGQETWFIGTDGGLYRSLDGLATVENLSLHGLRVSQYYSTLTSSANPEHVAAGSQDQGYQVTNGVAQDGEILAFNQIISGDYGHLTSSDGSHAYVYSVYPGFILIHVGENNPRLLYAHFPDDESFVPWLPPIVADPERATNFYFPATHLYRYIVNANWGARPTLWSDQDFASTRDEYLSAVVFSPLDPQLAFAATSIGRFFYSTDKGVHWTLSDSLVPDENWYYGQAIVASHLDSQLVYVGGSGYGVPAVYRSRDGGLSFEPWGEGLPDTLVYSLCEATDNTGRLMAGTETSAYLRGPDDPAWVDVTDNAAPITTYWSCEALTAEDTIRFGTYGRGIWDYQLDPDHTLCAPVEDYDGDGALCDVDCDDHDPAIYPGAEDPCDGIDQDCDGASELDADGDGALVCEDCDDANPSFNPRADDLCGDGIDQDCSGEDRVCEVEPRCSCASSDPTGGLALALCLLLIRRRPNRSA